MLDGAESGPGACVSLYGTKVHFVRADRGESGAGVTRAYSSLRQRENILSDRQKHRLADQLQHKTLHILHNKSMKMLPFFCSFWYIKYSGG